MKKKSTNKGKKGLIGGVDGFKIYTSKNLPNCKVNGKHNIKDCTKDCLRENVHTSNSLCLESFIKYCKENPSDRFFQALVNWVNVYGNTMPIRNIIFKFTDIVEMDTYYITDEEFLNK
jgi:hypothetical protein